MTPLGALEDAKAKVLSDTHRCMNQIRLIATEAFDTPLEGVKLLGQLRSEIYEDLNQIQHEYLIVCAAEWLLEKGVADPQAEWFWNPRQTGGSDEPDLKGLTGGGEVIAAEVTSSARPVGVIDKRMRNTLEKLSRQEGKLFYFVQSAAMEVRAKTKVRTGEWNIEVVNLLELPVVPLEA